MMPSRACWRAWQGAVLDRLTNHPPSAGSVPEDAWEHHISCAAAQGRGLQQLRAPRDAVSASGGASAAGRTRVCGRAAQPRPSCGAPLGASRSQQRAAPAARVWRLPRPEHRRHRHPHHHRHRPPCCARPPLRIRRRSLNDAAYQGLEYVPYCSTMPVPKACVQPRFMWVRGGGELPARGPGGALPACRFVLLWCLMCAGRSIGRRHLGHRARSSGGLDIAAASPAAAAQGEARFGRRGAAEGASDPSSDPSAGVISKKTPRLLPPAPLPVGPGGSRANGAGNVNQEGCPSAGCLRCWDGVRAGVGAACQRRSRPRERQGPEARRLGGRGWRPAPAVLRPSCVTGVKRPIGCARVPRLLRPSTAPRAPAPHLSHRRPTAPHRAATG
jgi:hypothetical protein